MISVRVQETDFDLGAEVAALRADDPRVGAVVSFVGTVRDLNDGNEVATLVLEHAPGLTENSLSQIAELAMSRFDIYRCLIVHRVGQLNPLEQIVLVAVTSAHRAQAFAACEFLMDYLKTDAPFWKKESTPQGERWVQARESDERSKAKWLKTGL